MVPYRNHQFFNVCVVLSIDDAANRVLAVKLIFLFLYLDLHAGKVILSKTALSKMFRELEVLGDERTY